MARSSSGEPPRTSSKRKGTRSVSSLTTAQLARKRANDREAQRAIRARTKDHIDRLERELDDARSSHSVDKTVQDLLRRNKALEEEVRRLREKVGVTSSPFSSNTVYDDNISTGSGAMPSPRTSPFPTGEYTSTPTSMPDYTPPQQHQQPSYVPLPNHCESWASAVPNPIHSNVSSPASAPADDFGPVPASAAAAAAAFMPTSMPPAGAMMPSAPNSDASSSHSGKAIKMEFDDVDDARFRLAGHGHHGHGHHQGVPLSPAAAFMQQHHEAPQAWNMYPMYYPQQMPSTVH